MHHERAALARELEEPAVRDDKLGMRLVGARSDHDGRVRLEIGARQLTGGEERHGNAELRQQRGHVVADTGHVGHAQCRRYAHVDGGDGTGRRFVDPLTANVIVVDEIVTGGELLVVAFGDRRAAGPRRKASASCFVLPIIQTGEVCPPLRQLYC